jgi:hypothetical protein
MFSFNFFYLVAMQLSRLQIGASGVKPPKRVHRMSVAHPHAREGSFAPSYEVRCIPAHKISYLCVKILYPCEHLYLGMKFCTWILNFYLGEKFCTRKLKIYLGRIFCTWVCNFETGYEILYLDMVRYLDMIRYLGMKFCVQHKIV